MKAGRIFAYGGPKVIQTVEMERPDPGEGQLRVRVIAAGVGPWDALIRRGKSAIAQTLPLTLGSDIAGVVDAVGANVAGFAVGDEVYGVTNAQFNGGYADYAIASAGTIARKPKGLSFIEAASAPVVAATAWQMLFDAAQAASGQRVLVQGGAGNVGAYAVQMAWRAGLEVIATATAKDAQMLRSLGAHVVVDYERSRFEDEVRDVDIVLDTVGGEVRERSYRVLKPGGILVSIVAPRMPANAGVKHGARTAFFIVNVTAERLSSLGRLFEGGKLAAQVGTVLGLADARVAHEMLAGAPHGRGKIVLRVGA